MSFTKVTDKETFFIWAAEFKKAHQFRVENESKTWAKKWWGNLPQVLRECLLYMVRGDSAERYFHVAWSSIPEDVRDDVMQCGRSIERTFRGAPWR